jgi:hypothetical protein
VKKVGHQLDGDTGAAIVGRANGGGYSLWAFPQKHAATRNFRADEGYRLLRRVDGIEIHADGVRLTWHVHGLAVWLEADNARDQMIDEIVRASAAVRPR